MSQFKNAIEIQKWLLIWLSTELEFDVSNIDIQEPFVNFGLSSRQAMVLMGDLQEYLGITLEDILVWEYPNIQQLSEYLADQTEQLS